MVLEMENGGMGFKKLFYIEKGKFTEVIVWPHITQNMHGRADTMTQLSRVPNVILYLF